MQLVNCHRLLCNPSSEGDASGLGAVYEKVRLVTDKTANKPRGYAFIEYVHTRDMKAAYKQADGKKIDNRRVLVDVERGRTVPNWRPRRLGGGLGTTRVGGEEVNQREQPPAVGGSRSEEPRTRDDREREREKSRERVREKEREKSRERSQDRSRDRDHRDERHHRDRERNRDRDKERERGRDRDRTRDRDRGRDRGRDHDRDRERDRDRHRDKEKDRDRDYEAVDADPDRGRSRDRDHDYDKVEHKHERDRQGDRERKIDHAEQEEGNHGWYEQPEHGHKRSEGEHGHYDYYDHYQGQGKYDNPDAPIDDERYENTDRYRDRYDHMEDNYGYDRATSELQEKDRDYRRSERSHSREYDY